MFTSTLRYDAGEVEMDFKDISLLLDISLKQTLPLIVSPVLLLIKW
jgi:hypothetical protein